MKKIRWLTSPFFVIALQWCLIIFLLCILLYNPMPDIDFAGLDTSNVDTVYIYPKWWGDPGVHNDVVRLSEEDTAMLLSKLNQVKLTSKTNRDFAMYWGIPACICFTSP